MYLEYLAECLSALFMTVLGFMPAHASVKCSESAPVSMHELLNLQVATAVSQEEQLALHKAVLDLHGEILLVLHWSMLAYTAFCKILKKYHKRTGRLLHAPDMQDVMQYPFCSTEVRL